MSETPYTAKFFERTLVSSYAAAKRILPHVLELGQFRSALDAGCGTGGFLRALLEAGIDDIVGIDGDWIPRDRLVIDERVFKAIDLSQGFELNRQFDLVLSLEVAEHLPEASSDIFVDSLTRHGPLILFSAAIPNQGGTGHINEQWPSYWARKFADRGYSAYDLLRPAIWNDAEIAWWYRQNVLLFANSKARGACAGLANAQPASLRKLNRIHPEYYAGRIAGGTRL
jgi:SAM-dependent methyltransferase